MAGQPYLGQPRVKLRPIRFFMKCTRSGRVGAPPRSASTTSVHEECTAGTTPAQRTGAVRVASQCNMALAKPHASTAANIATPLSTRSGDSR